MLNELRISPFARRLPETKKGRSAAWYRQICPEDSETDNGYLDARAIGGAKIAMCVGCWTIHLELGDTLSSAVVALGRAREGKKGVDGLREDS